MLKDLPNLWHCDLAFCEVNLIQRFNFNLPSSCNLVPDLRVDPQGPRQGQAGPGAANPSAQGAVDIADEPFHLGYFLQAGGAECVVAVEQPWDPVAAGVLIVTNDAI